MSDHSQTIVDVEVAFNAAARLGDEILMSLIKDGIVEPDPSDSVLGLGKGHRPGANYQIAIETENDDLPALQTNGVAIEIGRRAFDTGSNGIELRCDTCRRNFVPDATWADAVSAWSYGDDRANFRCPNCNQEWPVTEWRGPWQWGFGNLGITFWNWPRLSERFVESIGTRIGHRTIVVRSRT